MGRVLFGEDSFVLRELMRVTGTRTGSSDTQSDIWNNLLPDATDSVTEI